jgi:hypothetical protein
MSALTTWTRNLSAGGSLRKSSTIPIPMTRPVARRIQAEGSVLKKPGGKWKKSNCDATARTR